MPNFDKLSEDILIIVQGLGYELYDIEYLQNKINVYIDKPNGVTLDDCRKANKDIDVLLDVENPFAKAYLLTVSSPGINRHLKTPKHFMDAIGKKCIIDTHHKINDRKRFEGVIISCTNNNVELETVGESVSLNINNIKKARLDEV